MHYGINQLHIDEVDFCFCWMNVDVNFFRIYLNIKEITRETILWSISAGTALAQAMYVEPSRGQIPAERALFSVFK